MGTAGGLRRIESFDQRKEWYEGRSIGDSVYIFALSLLSVEGLLVQSGPPLQKPQGHCFTILPSVVEVHAVVREYTRP